MDNFYIYIFSADACISEGFEDMESAAHYLLAWTKANINLIETEGLFISIRPKKLRQGEDS